MSDRGWKGRGGPVRRLFWVGRFKPDPSEEVGWEIEHHLAEVADRLVAEGWSEVDARREAERRFGPLHRHRPTLERGERRRARKSKWSMGLSLITDALATTLRSTRRSPGFSAAIIVTLALGIGANAAIFGVVDRLLLRPPLHVADAERVVQLGLDRGDSRFGTSMTYPDYVDWLDSRAFAHVAAYNEARHTLGRGADAISLDVVEVSPSFFPLLGVLPRSGRFFADTEDGIGVAPTVVFSEEFWERAYGADPAVLGRTVDISGLRATVIGVAPRGFTGVHLQSVDAWMPIVATRAGLAELVSHTSTAAIFESRSSYWMSVVARLGEGVTGEAAAEEATRLHRSARAEDIARGRYPDEMRIALRSITAAGGTTQTRVVRWLAGVSLLVLLIACANVANLLLARSVKARRETAVRLALGVSRSRLVIEQFAGAVVLAGVGGLLAVALALWGRGALQRVLLPDVYFPVQGPGARVIAFAAVVSVVAGVLAAAVPALQATRASVASELREGSRGSSVRSRIRSGLAASQAALSLVLLVGAGLFVKSLNQIDRIDLGFDVDELVLATLDFEPSVQTARDVNALYARAREDAQRVPGVDGAAETTAPFYWAWAISLRVPGVDSFPRMPGGGPYVWGVGPGYFQTAGIQVVRGRGFEPSDMSGGQRVAIVGETMADSLWGGAALGECLIVGDEAAECSTIVGIAEQSARGGLNDDPFFQYYLPYTFLAESEAMEVSGLYVRAGDPDAVLTPLAATLRSLSPEVRFATVEPLRDVLDPLSRTWRLGASVFTALGVLALVVATVGLYSLLSFNVAQRRRELGIRSALGADRARLLRAVVAEATSLTVWGVGAGLVLTLIVSRWVGELLFQVSPRDPTVLVGVASLLVVVAMLASLLPARRATRVDPLEALRAE